MAGITDRPFREIAERYGAGMVVSEMIASAALGTGHADMVRKLGRAGSLPHMVQLAGCEPRWMAEGARIAENGGADIVDINFGCPVKKVVCKGASAGVLKDIDLMVRLTKAVVNSTHLPVTVKTRLGWDTDGINIDEVALRLQDAGIKALTIHARTRAQMYKGEADWEHISRIKQNPNIEIPVFGNGDVDSPQKAHEYKEKYACDGIMIGRGAIGYPWIFNEIKHFFETGKLLPEPTVADRLEAVKQHAVWSAEWKGERGGLVEMRQHYSNYFRGIPHFKEWRKKFLEVLTLEEMDQLIAETADYYREHQFS